jgi:hypothetical protein
MCDRDSSGAIRREKDGRVLEFVQSRDLDGIRNGTLLVQENDPSAQSVYLTPRELLWVATRAPLAWWQFRRTPRALDHRTWRNGWIGLSWTQRPRGWSFLVGCGRFGASWHTRWGGRDAH